MLEIAAPAKVTIKVFGKEYDIKMPTMKDVKMLQDAGKALTKGQSALELEMNFVESAGLPMEVIEQIPPKAYKELVDFLLSDLKG